MHGDLKGRALVLGCILPLLAGAAADALQMLPLTTVRTLLTPDMEFDKIRTN